MVNNTNKKIDGIVKKINENLSEELDRDNAEELLNDINVDLRVLKKNVEEKHKEIVDGKAKELKKIIDKNLDEDETTWVKTQDDLSKIKKGLEELKDEIKKLEESEKNLMVPQSGRGRRSRSASPNRVSETSEHTVKAAEKYVKLGQDAGGIFLGVPGAIAGAGAATLQGFAELGGNLFEEGMNNATDIGEQLIDVGADIYKDTTHVVADSIENFRGGAEKLTGQVVGEGADITKKFIKNFDLFGAGTELAGTLTKGIGHAEEVKATADRDARVAEANAKAEVAKAQAQAEIAKAQAEALKLQVELAKMKLNAQTEIPPK